MSIFERYAILRAGKALLKQTIYRPGRTVTILRGPLRGCRYVVNETSGWSPIYGGWEPAAQAMYSRFIGPGEVVYDLGANTGIHSLLFSRLAGPAGKVYAFEPLPLNVKEIASICALNGAGNVEVIELAVSDHSGTAMFNCGAHAKQGSLVELGGATGDRIPVKLGTLDSLIEQGLRPPDFLKLDIEGAESAALDGFKTSVGKFKPTFAIDLHTPEQDLKIGAFFQAHGYRLFRVKDENAVRNGAQRQMLAPIRRYDRGWGHADGVWGTVLAIHPQRKPADVAALEADI